MKFAFVSACACVAALAVAPTAAAETEEHFLSVLEAGGFQITDEAQGQALVDIAYAMCSGLDDGASPTDVYNDMVGSTGWQGSVAGFFIGAATTSFCPEYYQPVLTELEALGQG